MGSSCEGGGESSAQFPCEVFFRGARSAVEFYNVEFYRLSEILMRFFCQLPLLGAVKSVCLKLKIVCFALINARKRRGHLQNQARRKDMVHCVAARRGMRLRKSNSAPSLLILAESTEDDCDAISVCFADEVQGPEGRGCSKMVADSAMHSETVPLYFSSLRHVDSMELMARHLVDHINQVFPDSVFLRQISRFSAHSIHSRVLLQSAGEGGRKDVCLPNRNRSCALPHVDSCELIAPLLVRMSLLFLASFKKATPCERL